MKIPFLALILQGIPEQIAVVTLAFVIGNIPLAYKKIIPLGIILAFSSYVLRLFPITFGIHTVIIIGLLFVFLLLWGKTNLNAALIGSLTSFLSLIIAETVCVSLLMPLFDVTPETMFNDTTIRILISLPQVFLLFLIAFIVYQVKKSLKGNH